MMNTTCRLFAAFSIAGCLSLVAQESATPDRRLAALLRQDDEVLLRAVHTADRAAWLRLAMPGFSYVDEEGTVTPLNQLVRELEVTQTKPLRIVQYSVDRIGDTAIVHHEDLDEEAVRYLFFETWQKVNGQWRIRLLHVSNFIQDPPALLLTAAQVSELLGTYRAASGRVYVLRSRNGVITSQRDGGPERNQLAETRDVLFTPGQPRTRKVFLRDSLGSVTGFVVRYGGKDILYEKQKTSSHTDRSGRLTGCYRN